MFLPLLATRPAGVNEAPEAQIRLRRGNQEQASPQEQRACQREASVEFEINRMGSEREIGKVEN